MTRKIVWIAISLFASNILLSQEPSRNPIDVKVFGLFQSWALYEHGQEVWNNETAVYEPMDDRMIFLLRRSRAGIDVHYQDWVLFKTVLELDQVGPAILGDPEKVKPADVGLLESFVKVRLKKGDLIQLTTGFFRPQISRESITSAWNVNSMEKSATQTVIRKFLTGNPFGRAPGVNLGGRGTFDEFIHFRYDLGIFAPGHGYGGNGNNSPGWNSDILFSGRFSLELGDPENSKYGLGHKINYFGKRKGLSLAASGAVLTGDPGSRYAFGADMLANAGSWQMDGEIFYLVGNGEDPATNTTGHVRFGKNFSIGEKSYLQPFFLWGFLLGPTNNEDQAHAGQQGMFAGEFSVIGAGMMYYFIPNRVAVTMQYTMHTGEAGDAGPGSTVNPYFFENGIGSIHRGNWLGMGIQLTLN